MIKAIRRPGGMDLPFEMRVGWGDGYTQEFRDTERLFCEAIIDDRLPLHCSFPNKPYKNNFNIPDLNS